MALARIVPQSNASMDSLRQRLQHEWQHPAEGDAEPIIIEQSSDRFAQTRHLYVIWQDWQGLTGQQRSDVIMDAYEATHEQKDVQRVTVAMGVTPVEAERLGINYQIIPTVSTGSTDTTAANVQSRRSLVDVDETKDELEAELAR